MSLVCCAGAETVRTEAGAATGLAGVDTEGCVTNNTRPVCCAKSVAETSSIAVVTNPVFRKRFSM